MDRPLEQIHQTLQKHVGLHRQLLDTVRMERQALVEADLKAVQEATLSKQTLIEAIRQTEIERMKLVAELARQWRTPVRDLTLPQLVIAVQGDDPKGAEQLRSAYNALTVLVQRITEQNNANRDFVERSLEHVEDMKRNILGETVPKSNTYTAHGQKSNPVSGARLISKEA